MKKLLLSSLVCSLLFIGASSVGFAGLIPPNADPTTGLVPPDPLMADTTTYDPPIITPAQTQLTLSALLGTPITAIDMSPITADPGLTPTVVNVPSTSAPINVPPGTSPAVVAMLIAVQFINDLPPQNVPSVYSTSRVVVCTNISSADVANWGNLGNDRLNYYGAYIMNVWGAIGYSYLGLTKDTYGDVGIEYILYFTLFIYIQFLILTLCYLYLTL